jgi:hypothetical protein
MSLISHDVACGLSDVIIAHAISSKKKKKSMSGSRKNVSHICVISSNGLIKVTINPSI